MGKRISLFGIDIDALRMDEAVDQVLAWAQSGGLSCRYVVTPNVDHAVMFQQREDLRRAYRDASLVLADGAPVVLASRLVGKSLPERVAGSDLAPALFSAAEDENPLSVYLLGAAPGVAERAAQHIVERWSAVRIVGTYSPPLGFEKDPEENARIMAKIAAARPQLLLLGLGAPKQELWVQAHRHELQAGVAMCIGATIDFLAGERRRAPVWMRKCGLEWLHRVAQEPRRLIGRYLHDARVFPSLIWREWMSGARQAAPAHDHAKAM